VVNEISCLVIKCSASAHPATMTSASPKTWARVLFADFDVVALGHPTGIT
jgi:hypothetical protein